MKCVPLAEDPREIVRRHLAAAANGWSVGTWGAIGEFQYDDGEPGLVVDLDALSVTSRRGELHIGELDEVTPFALIDDSGRTREIAFCSFRPGAGRVTIHELSQTEFDLGVGAPHVDIAGPASLSSSRPFQPRGGTGFAVASIVEYVSKPTR